MYFNPSFFHIGLTFPLISPTSLYTVVHGYIWDGTFFPSRTHCSYTWIRPAYAYPFLFRFPYNLIKILYFITVKHNPWHTILCLISGHF